MQAIDSTGNATESVRRVLENCHVRSRSSSPTVVRFESVVARNVRGNFPDVMFIGESPRAGKITIFGMYMKEHGTQMSSANTLDPFGREVILSISLWVCLCCSRASFIQVTSSSERSVGTTHGTYIIFSIQLDHDRIHTIQSRT